MRTNINRILLAFIAAGLPVLSIAQSAAKPVIVPPPVMPQQASSAAPATAASSPTSAPAVLPAAKVTSANPAETAPLQAGAPGTVGGEKTKVESAAAAIDIALPDVPKKPSEATNNDLKPSPPKLTVKPKKSTSSVSDTSNTSPATRTTPKVDLPPDPFSGIVGTPVSDSQLNRFTFPEAVDGVYFNEGAPLPECPKDALAQDPCKPVFLNGRKVLLLQLRAGAKGPVQMLVHLHSGRILTFNLMPVAGPGAIVRTDSADDGISDNRLAELEKTSKKNDVGLTNSERDIELLSRFARGDIPAGFEVIPVGKPVRFEFFDVIPLATWSGGHLKAHLMQVKAFGATPVAINAGLFRSANVKALALDRETITDKAPATLYVLESVPEETR